MIRLRVPDEGECVVHDLVRGDVRFEFAQLGDHVILRSDGVPTYNFANPIDDADMGITHVIRGEDLLSSTPRQVLVLPGACGAPVPSFAHLPLLFGPDRKRLSKRHGATSVEELREAGYLAEAVVNFLALLGWHFDSERELFTLSELIGLFSLERVNPAPAVFDAKKLEWMNGVYLRALPTFDLAERLIAYLARARLAARLAARADRRGHAAGAGEDRDAGRVRAALLVPLRPGRDRSGGLGQGRRARARRGDPGRRAAALGAATGASTRSRRRCAAVCERAGAQAARRLRAGARRDHRHEHLAGPVRERAPAGARRDARASHAAPPRASAKPTMSAAPTAGRAVERVCVVVVARSGRGRGEGERGGRKGCCGGGSCVVA